MDAFIYFWIFQSLMDTMDELTEKKQQAKLDIFTKLRNLLVVSVVVATSTDCLRRISWIRRRKERSSSIR